MGRFTIVTGSNVGVWSIKRNNIFGFSVESMGPTPQHGRLGNVIGCLQPEFVASLFVLYVGFCYLDRLCVLWMFGLTGFSTLSCCMVMCV